MIRIVSHNRYRYSPLGGRPVYEWPGGKRLAFYVGLNLEHFSFGNGLGAELAPGGPPPDVLNYAWRDWGNRVGAWRMLDMFRELAVPVSLLVNSSLYEYCPELIAAFRDDGAEIVAHGRTNAERQGELAELEEAALIAECTATIARHERRAPEGWLGPWISQSAATPDLLKEAGYKYLLDWCHDDQPVWFATRAGPILSIPYPQEINDLPAIVVRRASAREFSDMIIDQFDEMLEQSGTAPLVCAVALHAYIAGQPFRLRHLRRAFQHIAAHRERIWLTTSGAIARHVESLPPQTVPRT